MTELSSNSRAATPWSAAEFTGAIWTALLGVGLLVWSWWEASGSASLNDQVGWIVIAVIGTGLGAFALVGWVRSGRRAVGVRRAQVVAVVQSVASAGMPAVSLASGDLVLVTYPDATRYHREACLLVRGKPVLPLSTQARISAGLQPCEMCKP